MEKFDKDSTGSNTGIPEARRQLEEAEAAYDAAVVVMEEKEAALNQVRDVMWPKIADVMGMKKFPFTDGAVVDVKSEVYAAIKKDAAQKAAAHAWLDSVGLGGIIKRRVQIELAKGDAETLRKVLDVLHPLHLHVTVDESVHPQTLYATVRERLENGEHVPFDLLGIGMRSRASLKLPKKI